MGVEARDVAVLERECAGFCRYLLDREPSRELTARYLEAHALGVVTVAGSATRFDRALVALARGGRLAARCCDVHARFFRRGGALRRKLVLCLALAECDPTLYSRVDEVHGGGPASLWARIAWWLFVSGVLGVIGLCLFLPLRLVCAVLPGGDA